MRKSWTDEKIAEYAERLRKALKIPTWGKINVPLLIEKLQTDRNPKVHIDFHEVPASLIRGASAKTEPRHRVIYYKTGLMDLLMGGGALAAAIFLEEIAHVFLHPEADVIYHSEGLDRKAANDPDYLTMEDEAEKFVFYSFAPVSEVYSETDYHGLVHKFDMPVELARRYVRHLEATRNRIEGNLRPPPTNTTKFFKPKSPKIVVFKTVSRSKSEIIGPLFSYANANQATAQHNPSARYLDEVCRSCGQKSIRMMGGCKQCLCGDDNGCS